MQNLPQEIQNRIALFALPRPLSRDCLLKIKNPKNITTYDVLVSINKKVKKFNDEKSKREKQRHMLELMIYLDAYFEKIQTGDQLNESSKMRVRVIVQSMCTRLLGELEHIVNPSNTMIILMKKHA